MLAALGLWLVVLAVVGGSTAAAKTGRYVYVQTNDPTGNDVVAYRSRNGALTRLGAFSTEGTGRLDNPPFSFPILDSQGGIATSKRHKLLFAVNGGSNDLTSFRVKKRTGALTFADREPTGGEGPLSVTAAGKLVYVLNGIEEGVTGFRVRGNGRLSRIPGSTRTFPDGTLPGQVQLHKRTRTLVVTLRGRQGENPIPGQLATMTVRRDGSLSAPRYTVTTGQKTPFGFDITRRGDVILSDAGTDPPSVPDSTAASWRLRRNASPTLNGSVLMTGQISTCWVVLTGDDRTAYMTAPIAQGPEGPDDPGTKNGITIVRVNADGTLAPDIRFADAEFLALDEDLSDDDRYLYVLTHRVNLATFEFQGGQIEVFRVAGDGSLTRVGDTGQDLPGGASGLVAT